MKTYILLKDLPDSNAGDEYIFNVNQGVYFKNGNVLDSYWLKENVEDNSAWFRLKREFKKYILTTDDNVNIMEGDTYHAVQKRTFDILNNCRFELDKPDQWHTFSTKEAAEEYILLNKPVLSLNDLLSVWEHPVDLSDDSKVSPLFERFKKVAQSKINQ